MVRREHQHFVRHNIAPAVLAVLLLLPTAFAAAGKKATLASVTQQYQQATAAVIASARDFFAKMNSVEQNGSIDQLAFEHKPIDNAAMDSLQILTPQQLQVRVDAMNAVSEYTQDLASLAAGSSLKTFGNNLQGLSKNLKQCSTDAGSLPDLSASDFLKSKSFPGIVSGAVIAVGSIIALIEGRRAQTEIKKQIVDQDKAVTLILTTIGDEMQLAYERQRSNDSGRESQLTILYNNNLTGPNSNVFLGVLLAHQIEDSRGQMAALTSSNPAKAITAMTTAHQAMVKYVAADKNSADISDLVGTVGNFFSTAQASQSTPAGAAPAK